MIITYSHINNMLTVDETTKVLLLPENIERLEVISVALGNVQKSLAISEGLVYELREIGPSSEFDLRGEPRLPSGEPVRSLILESNEEASTGAVLSNPNFITLTRFDFVFPFLQWMSSHLDIYMTRFHTSEDITEGFSNSMGSHHLSEILEPIVQNCIDRTCDAVKENGENFYKVSLMKVCQLLATKIDSLKNLVILNPNYAISKKIKETLSDSHGDIPELVFQQQVSRYSTDFVFGSFLSNKLKEKYITEHGEDYSELEAFLKNQESKQKSAAIAEQNLASIAMKSKVDSDKSKTAKAPKPLKKKHMKVAVGKGALDHFFKKN